MQMLNNSFFGALHGDSARRRMGVVEKLTTLHVEVSKLGTRPARDHI
jgi:hypothetical protein